MGFVRSRNSSSMWPTAPARPLSQSTLMDSPLILSLGLASQSGGGIESIRLPSPWIRPPPSWDWHLRFGGVVHGIERSEEHTSGTPVTNAHLVCRLLLETQKNHSLSLDCTLIVQYLSTIYYTLF